MFDNNYLIKLFLYFAKFPQREGIAPMFNVGDSKFEEYAQLRSHIETMDTHSLTDIKNYVFGSNLDAVSERVNKIQSGEDYMFVDFGEIVFETARPNRLIDYTSIAVTVAYRLKSFSGDLIEQAISFDKALQKITNIRNLMYADQHCTPWLKNLSPSHQIIPFISDRLSSVGWSLIFEREGHDTFGAKNTMLL